MKHKILISAFLASQCLLASQTFAAETDPVDAAAASGPAEGTDLTTADHIASYLANSQTIVDQIKSTSFDSQVIVSSIDSMLNEVSPVLQAYSAVFPLCKEQLDKVIELLPQIETWTAQEIRTNIEAGKALPATNGNCYPARDVVAHPAIVRALVKTGGASATRLLREINEAIEHMTDISGLFPAEEPAS